MRISDGYKNPAQKPFGQKVEVVLQTDSAFRASDLALWVAVTEFQ